MSNKRDEYFIKWISSGMITGRQIMQELPMDFNHILCIVCSVKHFLLLLADIIQFKTDLLLHHES